MWSYTKIQSEVHFILTPVIFMEVFCYRWVIIWDRSPSCLPNLKKWCCCQSSNKDRILTLPFSYWKTFLLPRLLLSLQLSSGCWITATASLLFCLRLSLLPIRLPHYCKSLIFRSIRLSMLTALPTGKVHFPEHSLRGPLCSRPCWPYLLLWFPCTSKAIHPECIYPEYASVFPPG